MYTKPRHEKLTAKSLESVGTDYFLPIQTEDRQWHDRKKKIQAPIFPGYILVKVRPPEITQVYHVDGFVKFISTDDRPDIVSNEIIRELKRALSDDFETSSQKFQSGDKVIVNSGPMKGLAGHLVRFAEHSKLVIDVDVNDKSVLITIPSYFTEKVEEELLSN